MGVVYRVVGMSRLQLRESSAVRVDETLGDEFLCRVSVGKFMVGGSKCVGYFTP